MSISSQGPHSPYHQFSYLDTDQDSQLKPEDKKEKAASPHSGTIAEVIKDLQADGKKAEEIQALVQQLTQLFLTGLMAELTAIICAEKSDDKIEQEHKDQNKEIQQEHETKDELLKSETLRDLADNKEDKLTLLSVILPRMGVIPPDISSLIVKSIVESIASPEDRLKIASEAFNTAGANLENQIKSKISALTTTTD